MRLSITTLLFATAALPVYAQTITTQSPLPNAMVGRAYNVTFSATGGTGALNLTLDPPSQVLPAGLSFTPGPSGVASLGGTPLPNAGDQQNFTLKVTDSANVSTTKTFAITVLQPITILMASLANATVGVPYNQQLQANGGSGIYVWNVTNLPNGLTVNQQSQAITGTPTTAATANVVVTVQDNSAPIPFDTNKAYSITVAAGGAPSITTGSPLPNGSVGINYSQTLTAAGGTGTGYRFALQTGSTLPGGLNLSTTGVLSGVPSAAVVNASFTVVVTDSANLTGTKPFSLTIVSPPIITTASLPNGTVGTPYSQTLSASGGSGAGYTYSLEAGSLLPPNLTLSAGGLISGTPTVVMNATFTVVVTDSASAKGTRQFSITTVGSGFSITTTALPNWTVQRPYAQTLTTSGAAGAVTWSVTAGGSLPQGLTLATGTGVISGTPVTAAAATFTVQATDSASQTATKTFSITINPAPAVSTTTLAGALRNVVYTVNLTSSGGTSPLTWSVASGTLPAGMALSSIGLLAGTPAASGTFNFTVQVTDGAGATGIRELTLVVTDSTITIAVPTLTTALINVPYPATTLTASGGVGTYTWSVASGALPPGMTLSPTGQLSGTPTASGTFNFVVQAVDSNSISAQRSLSMVVAAAQLLITTTTPLQQAVVGTPYTVSFAATGGTSGYQWSLVSGSLPAGLNFAASGTLSGTPASAGAASFTVRVTDSASSSTTSQFFLLVVASPLTITSVSPIQPDAFLNVPYNATIQATGGSSPSTYSFSVTAGSLPPGLTLASSGAIVGTPTQAGTFNFTARVSDGNGGSSTKPFSLAVIAPSLTITTATLPVAARNSAYTASLAASGGAAPLNWSVILGVLPPGLTMSATGVISGTPSNLGTYNFRVQVRDANQVTAERDLSIQVATFSITTLSLNDANAGAPYSATLTVIGGTAPYQWSVSAGSLPPGITLSAAGQLSGTSTQAGNYTFTVQVRDNTNATATQALALRVITGLTISTQTLPSGTVGVSYSQTLSAAGGTPPYSWIVISGALPVGVTLSPQTGTISGTPTNSTQSPFSFVMQVTDNTGANAQRPFSIAIASGSAPAVTTSSLPNATPGIAYNQTLTASGGAAPYSWSVISGQLPAGLSLSAAGVISGTTVQAGSFGFVVQVRDTNQATATRQLQIVVAGAGQLTITSSALPSAVLGSVYTNSLATLVNGGTAPYQWSVTGGALPPGILLSTAGLLTGTPQQQGTFTFTIQVRDASQLTATQQFQLVVLPAASSIGILNSSLPNATLSSAYSQTLIASGGTAPYQWTVSEGILPFGLTLSQTSGVISGVPTQGGGFQFSVRVTDSAAPPASATRVFLLTVTTGLSIVNLPPNSAIGTNYSFTMQASGGTAPFTWSVVSGALPPGISLVPNTGVLNGIPTIVGTYSFVLQVTDGTGATTTRSISIQVNPTLSITTTALPGGTAGAAYNQTLAATGGSGSGYTWSTISGSLPGGLTLNSQSGAISGTPSGVGTFSFTAQVNDSSGSFTSRQLSITIGTTLSITTTSLPNAGTGVAYNQTVLAAGGQAPFQWSISAGTLPPGLSINAATGVVSGSPSAAGTFTFTVRVQDAGNVSNTRELTIVVTTALSISTPTELPGAAEGTVLAQPLTAVGGTPPYVWSIAVGVMPPGLTLASTGTIAGTPAALGNYSFILQVTDALQQSVQKAFTLVVSGRVSILTPAVLPSGTVRAPYNETLSASGGVPPYTWSLAPGGSPPIGITVSPEGIISGTPTTAGPVNFTVQVTDSAGTTVTRTLTLSILQTLTITTASPLPSGTAGVPYAQAVAAAGGQPPYSWSAAGTLPNGVTLSSGGILTGTPLSSGTFTFTAEVTDNQQSRASATFTLVVRLPATPPITLSGVTESVQPAQQPRVAVAIGAPFPVPITGTLTMTFAPDAAVPGDDPAVVFTNGRRTVDFTIPANATQAQLPEGFAMQTGTVAGTISLAVSMRAGTQDVTPTPAPNIIGIVPKTAPVIRSVRATRNAAGLQIDITGYSTTREITTALFRFTPVAGSSLQTTELTVPLSDGARRWYQSEASRPFGSQFTLSQQFNVQGDTSSISSVTVTMSNGQGQSQPASSNFQ